jgi:ribosomal protein L37AE/L43A
MEGDSPNLRNRQLEEAGQMTIQFNPQCPECERRVPRAEIASSLWGTCRRCEIALIENLPFGAN